MNEYEGPSVGKAKASHPAPPDAGSQDQGECCDPEPGQDATCFNEEMWMDLDDFFRLFNKMLPKRVNPMSVEELIALFYDDNKCRFEFQCVAGTRWQPVKG